MIEVWSRSVFVRDQSDTVSGTWALLYSAGRSSLVRFIWTFIFLRDWTIERYTIRLFFFLNCNIRNMHARHILNLTFEIIFYNSVSLWTCLILFVDLFLIPTFRIGELLFRRHSVNIYMLDRYLALNNHVGPTFSLFVSILCFLVV